LSLNKYYTRLSSRFTECRFPAKITFFPVQALGMAGAFAIISSIPIGALKFEVLESHGGHTPGLVFFLNREFGLLFTSDFLLNVQSLSADEKEHLSLYRYLLTNPNSDNQVYRKEVAALKAFMLSLNESLKPSGRSSIIFPGHGSYYRIEEMSA
ncbi:MAG: MBL fold metallo-hydrolase, partial [bacterium]